MAGIVDPGGLAGGKLFVAGITDPSHNIDPSRNYGPPLKFFSPAPD